MRASIITRRAARKKDFGVCERLGTPLRSDRALTDYASTVIKAMQGQPVILVAAGVALTNRTGKLLLLQRPDGKWDLPGGHTEAGESLEQPASRELLEETGFTSDTLDMLGIASGKETFYPKRNAYYVTAVYHAQACGGILKLSREHLDGKLFALDALPASLPVTVGWVAARRVSAPER